MCVNEEDREYRLAKTCFLCNKEIERISLDRKEFMVKLEKYTMKPPVWVWEVRLHPATGFLHIIEECDDCEQTD